MKKNVSIIALIVALALVCVGIVAVAWFIFGSVLTRGMPFDVDLISASADESKTVKIGETVALQVTNEAGDVTVKGGDVEQITIKVHKTSWANTTAKAEQELKNFKVEIVEQGDTLIVRYENPDQGIHMGKSDTMDFTITVPTEFNVTVDAGFGEVNLSDIKGDGDLKSDFGDISVKNAQGGLTVETESGAVTATSITAGASAIDLHSGFGNITLEKASAGNVKLDSESGEIEMINVRASGEVEMSAKFGDTNFENGSARSLTVKTDSGKVKLVSLNISGELKAEGGFGEIDLQKVKAGSYDVSTNSGSITLEGAQGKVKAATGFGDITITKAENATLDLNTQSGSIEFEGSLGEGPHSIHSDFGQISLSLPIDSALNVDLQTEFGNINSDIPVTVVLNGEVDQSHHVGTINGGGPELKVSTQSGNITIKALKK